MSQILGYRIYTPNGSAFILDVAQLDFIRVLLPLSVRGDRERLSETLPLIEAAVALASKKGSVTVKGLDLAIEVISHKHHAPRFVCLRSRQGGHSFYTTYDGEDRYMIGKGPDGRVVYDILGFADNTAEAQYLLYRSKIPSFNVQVSIDDLNSDGNEMHG